jgi:hypothetical protein
MDIEKIYKEVSPLKFNINNDYVDKIQENNPIIISLDNKAFDNFKIIMNRYFNDMRTKYNLLSSKAYIIENIYINSIKIFLGVFILLYLIAPKFDMLRVPNDNDELKDFKPNMLRISLISALLSTFFLVLYGIDLLSDIKDIIFA